MDTSLVDVFSIVASSATAAGLFFTALTISRENKTRQTQVLENIFNDIRELEKQLAEISETDKNKLKDWDSRFFNTLEWFAFQINSKQVTQSELIDFFKLAIINWYEKIFTNHFNRHVIEDEQSYPEFKRLYKRFKNAI